MQKPLGLLHIHTQCYRTHWADCLLLGLECWKHCGGRDSPICLCKHIWIRCGIIAFLSLLVLLFQESGSKLEIYLSQCFSLVKSYWLHLTLLSGCQTMHYSICISSRTLSKNFGIILQSSTLFSPCKQIRLNITCCLIKLIIEMKEPLFSWYEQTKQMWKFWECLGFLLCCWVFHLLGVFVQLELGFLEKWDAVP